MKLNRIRNSRFAFFLCAASLVFLATCSSGAEVRRKPNIVLVVTDDQGYGDTGAYWDTDVETPVMDSVAKNGVRFVSFRVNPLCAPTRSSLLSGQYSLENGMWRGPSSEPDKLWERAIKKDVTLLPQYLKEAGYSTGIFGKWHLGYESPNIPNDRGFDEFYGFLAGSHVYYPENRPTILHNREHYPTKQHLTDLFTERALDFIQANKDRPFFCYIPFNAVHGPLLSPERANPSGLPKWLEKYKNLGLEGPRGDYNAVLSHADDNVGKVIQRLKDLGLEQDTLLIYLSDNGALLDKYPGNNGPLRGAKGTTYEGGIRVPAVMQWPGVIPAGIDSTENAVHFDIFSTIMEAAGLEIPKMNGQHPVHGKSLLTHLKSGAKEPLPDRYLFWDLYGKMGAVHGNWKLVGEIENHHGKFAEAVPVIQETPFELYDLSNDLGETKDLAAEHPGIAKDLKDRLVAWFVESTQ